MRKSILIINSGSSSVKFSLIDCESHKSIMSGLAEELGGSGARVTYKADGAKTVEQIGGGDHEVAMRRIFAEIDRRGLRNGVVAVGHRVVHGGERFKSSTLIDDEVLAAVEDATVFAPLHNPANLLGIRAVSKVMPGVPQTAVFDTAFHQSMPERAYRYAVPAEWYEQYGVRRYGFHGTSHRYVSEQAAEALGRAKDDCAVIVAHLGNGASLAAVLNGKSVDTTMGFTPLEGLSMGTRSGDVDPALVTYMAGRLDVDAAKIVDFLNKESGLLGVSRLSSDQRELEEAAARGDRDSILALEIFAFRVAKYIGSMMVSLPWVDAIVFTAGAGENGAMLRAAVAEHLAVFGYRIDSVRNEAAVRGRGGVISTDGTPCMMVIGTNEELMIALDTKALLGAA